MKKEDIILLSVYPGYHPVACKRTIKNNDRMITIFYDDVILETNSSKPNLHGDRLVDKRYRKFIDVMPVPNFLLFQMAGKYHGDQTYKQLIQTATNKKITIGNARSK